ncbi:MAG: hypothetical protein IT350_01625 [Deltaproteobacteria bacterium]|nr:hypothetical protein [Deltaproteobacteria bacterium]
MRLSLILIVLAAVFAVACEKPETAAVTTPAAATPAPPKSAEPPKPPYTLATDEERAIDEASNRAVMYIESEDSVRKMLADHELELTRCDAEVAKNSDQCLARTGAFYCMRIGDDYRGLKDEPAAVRFYMEALKRTVELNDRSEKEYRENVKAGLAAAKSDAGRAMTESYHAARYHFQSYKDFAEMARYEKRLVEIAIENQRDEMAKDSWSRIENSVKTAATHRAEFLKHVAALRAIKDKIPEQYRHFYDEIMSLEGNLKIERI